MTAGCESRVSGPFRAVYITHSNNKAGELEQGVEHEVQIKTGRV